MDNNKDLLMTQKTKQFTNGVTSSFPQTIIATQSMDSLQENGVHGNSRLRSRYTEKRLERSICLTDVIHIAKKNINILKNREYTINHRSKAPRVFPPLTKKEKEKEEDFVFSERRTDVRCGLSFSIDESW